MQNYPDNANTVIALYRPHAGKEAELHDVLKTHVPVLRELGLATDKPVLMLKSTHDGTILEIFEWKSQEAVATAHEHPRVLEMWKRFGECCDYISLGALKESEGPFPHFERFFEE